MTFPESVGRFYVLHCKKLPERKPLLQSVLPELGIHAEWVEDFDAEDISWLDLIRFCRARRLTRQEISIFLKHRYVINDMVKRGCNTAFVLEDDAIFTDEFRRRAIEYFAAVPNDYDIIFFGEGANNHGTEFVNPFFCRADSSRSASGYLVTLNGCKRLRPELNRIDRPIDLRLNMAIRKHRLAAYWSEPPLLGNGSERGIFAHSLYVHWRQNEKNR